MPATIYSQMLCQLSYSRIDIQGDLKCRFGNEPISCLLLRACRAAISKIRMKRLLLRQSRAYPNQALIVLFAATTRRPNH